MAITGFRYNYTCADNTAQIAGQIMILYEPPPVRTPSIIRGTEAYGATVDANQSHLEDIAGGVATASVMIVPKLTVALHLHKLCPPPPPSTFFNLRHTTVHLSPPLLIIPSPPLDEPLPPPPRNRPAPTARPTNIPTSVDHRPTHYGTPKVAPLPVAASRSQSWSSRPPTPNASSTISPIGRFTPPPHSPDRDPRRTSRCVATAAWSHSGAPTHALRLTIRGRHRPEPLGKYDGKDLRCTTTASVCGTAADRRICGGTGEAWPRAQVRSRAPVSSLVHQSVNSSRQKGSKPSRRNSAAAPKVFACQEFTSPILFICVLARLQAAIDGSLVCYNYAAADARLPVGLLLLALAESDHLCRVQYFGLTGHVWSHSTSTTGSTVTMFAVCCAR